MRLLDPLWLGLIYGLSELYLAFTRRSRAQVPSSDRRSLLILWAVIVTSIFVAIQMVWMVPGAALPARHWFYIFRVHRIFGRPDFALVLIGYLGCYFTVNVAVDVDQEIVAFPDRTDTSAILPTLGRFWHLSGSVFA